VQLLSEPLSDQFLHVCETTPFGDTGTPPKKQKEKKNRAGSPPTESHGIPPG
jgi:hypothetical protein